MSNCIGNKKPELMPVIFAMANSLKEYVGETGARRIANTVLTKNNGNVISRNPDGTPSATLPVIQQIVGHDNSLIFRMDMYSDSFLTRYGKWETAEEEPQLDFITAGVNIETTGKSPLFYSNGTIGDINIQDTELAEESQEMRKCLGFAEDGLKGKFTKGGMWKVEKDFFDSPTHREGGTDIVVTKKGVMISNGKTLIKAAKGAVAPQGQKSPRQYSGYSDNWLNALYGAAAMGITHIGPSINSINSEPKKNVVNPNDKNSTEQAPVLQEKGPAETAPEPVVIDETINNENNNYALSWTSRYEGFGEMPTKNVKCEEGRCAAFVELEAFDNFKPNLPEGYTFNEFINKLGMYGDAWHMTGNLKKHGATVIEDGDAKKGDVMFINNATTTAFDNLTPKQSGDKVPHVGVIDEVGDGYYVVLHTYGAKMYRQKVNKKDGKFENSGSFTLAHIVRPDYSQL